MANYRLNRTYNSTSNGGAIGLVAVGFIIYAVVTFFWAFAVVGIFGFFIVGRFVIFPLVKNVLATIVITVVPLVTCSYYVAANYVYETEWSTGPASALSESEMSRLYHVSTGGQIYVDSPLDLAVYRFWRNRLYVQAGWSSEFSEIDTADMRHSWLPGLERNLTKVMDRLYQRSLRKDEAASEKLRSLLEAPGLNDNKTILVVDGDLVSFNFQNILPDRRILRTFTHDSKKLSIGIENMQHPVYLGPQTTAIVDALPRGQQELAAMALSAEDWPAWAAVLQTFNEIAAIRGTQALRSKTETIDALTKQRAVVFVVAHSDGYSIYMPDGDRLTVDDIEAHKELISQNRPLVFLFSCETAKETKLSSFAAALLSAGAQMVVAPVEKVEAEDALWLLDNLLKRCFVDGKEVNVALEESMRETGVLALERWIARSEGPKVNPPLPVQSVPKPEGLAFARAPSPEKSA